MKMNKKGQVMQNLGALGIGIATLAIVMVIAFILVANVEDQIHDTEASYVDAPGSGCNSTINLNCSSAHNATQTLQSAAEELPGWVPLVVIVAIGGIILGMVAMFKK